MEMTPPISPSGAFDISDIISEKAKSGFHCTGEALKKTPLDHKGFILSGDATLPYSTYRLKQSVVKLFQEDYDIDNANKIDLHRLFMISRNKFNLINNAQKVGTYGFNTDHGNLASTVDFDAVRQELREFYVMLRVFISLQGEDDNTSWAVHEALPTLIKGLGLIRSQLGWLTELPIYVLNISHQKNGFKSPSFHLLHSHLELRWLHISVLWTLASCTNSSSRFEATQSAGIIQTYGSEASVPNLLQSAIKLCLVDLIEVAVLKFNKLSQEMVVHTSLFNCMCVKELWLLLRFVTEYLHDDNPKCFWKIVDETLELIVKPDGDMPKKSWRPVRVPKQIFCSEPGLFALWLLRHVGELFMYSKDGILDLVESVDSGQGSVKKVMTTLTGSHDIDEHQRRTLIGLIRSFMGDPWRPRPEPIMMLWEGFSKKLDCAFQLPGSITSSYAIASETIDDILASVEFDRSSSKQTKNLNSFEMFLALLGAYLKQDQSQWKLKMCGRFYSKLSEKKVDGLSEMGLFHLTQLFLSVAKQTDIEELGLRFQKLVRFSLADEKRDEMIMKAMLSFLYLFVEKGKPISPMSHPLTNIVNSLIEKNKNPKVVQVFIDNLQCLIQKTEILPTDLHEIFGVWVKNFLMQNHRNDSTTLRNLLNLMLDVLLKVQKYLDCNNTVGGGVEELFNKISEHLLPFLKDPKCNDWDLIADLAVNFTLISLELNNSCTRDSLVHFMMSEDLMFVRRYLHKILITNKIINIIDDDEALQVLTCQAWVRCSTLSSSVDQERDRGIARRVIMMPLLKTTFNLDPDTFNDSSDPLLYLIEALGHTCSSTSKKTFLMLVEPIKKIIHMIKLSLFPPKSKDTSWVPEKNLRLEKEVIVRAYSVLGKLTSECSLLIFEKNTSSNLLIFLVNNIILHPSVFNMDVRLPLAMDDGLRKSIFLYLIGLIKLDPKKEKVLHRFISDIIRIYVPRFGVIPDSDPFTKIWDEPEYMEPATYIITSVCEILLQVDKNTNLPCKYYIQGLHLINQLVKRNDCDEFLMGILIDNVLPSCLYVVAKVTDISASNRRMETEKTLKLIFESEAYHTNPHLWEQPSNVLHKLSMKYLGFTAQIFMRMLIFLVKDFKPIIKRFLPTLEANIKDVISKRGSGTDKTLESFLAKVKGELLK